MSIGEVHVYTMVLFSVHILRLPGLTRLYFLDSHEQAAHSR